MENRKGRIDTACIILSGDDRADHACKRIPDSSCTNLPLNYVLNVVNGTASKLAEQVASAKVALPWLLSAIGAPASLVGFLLPLRQAGTLLPQLFISGQMRRFPVRKWFWVGSAIVQVLMLILMIVAALTLPPFAAGMLVATFLLLFSLARGMGSLSFQDVTGKTIPKGRRGRMLAARSMIGGLMSAATGAAALFMAILPSAFQNPYVYGSIFVLLGFAEAGVLLGRKTFLIDRVDPAERTTYVAFANTAMGVVTLIFGFLGVLAQIFGIPTLIVVLIVLGLTGAAVSYFLPETSKD